MAIDNISNLFPTGGASPRTPIKEPKDWSDDELLEYLTSPPWRKYNESLYVTVAAQAKSRGLDWDEFLY